MLNLMNKCIFVKERKVIFISIRKMMEKIAQNDVGCECLPIWNLSFFFAFWQPTTQYYYIYKMKHDQKMRFLSLSVKIY